MSMLLAMQDFKQEVDIAYGSTVLHPAGLTAVVLLGFTMLVVPRRFAILPMIVMACFIAPAQRIVVSGFDFDLLRVMLLFGWARLIIRGEFRMLNWKLVDLLVPLLAIAGTITYIMLWQTKAAFTNRLGWSYELLGMYFLFRFLVRDWQDIRTIAIGFALVSIPVALFFMVERATGRNLFGQLGGVPTITQVRGGRLRCQGAFAHPILAGVFWASVIPLMASLWWRGGRDKTLAITGLLMGVFIVIASSSSTPVMALIFVVLGGLMVYMRHWMGYVFWGGVTGVVLLDLVMNKPVYHLIARINIFSSSTGWHRYNLIHQAVLHFSEWGAIGTTRTDHWGPGLYDVTNQYVLMGVRGGAITLVLFVAIIVMSFLYMGRAWRIVNHDRARLALAWGLGVALFTHVMSFISVSYFGQIEMVWYLLLASIASVAPSRQEMRVQLHAIQQRRWLTHARKQPRTVAVAARASS